MPIMNFDLQDGMPPVSFSINGEGAERMMNFMSECQQDRDAHAMQSAEIAELRAKVESLAADADRLDYVAECAYFNKSFSYINVGFNLDSTDGDLRKAIDMAKEKA